MLSKDDMQTMLDRMAEAYRAGDAAGCAAFFAESAQLHSPFAAPAIGRQAIRALHQDWTSEPNEKSFAILEFSSTEGMAWCLARFSEGAETGEGTSLIVLEPDEDGSWLIQSCCLHGDPEKIE